jgi:predicted site-specific integrase-resolvase
MGMLLHPKTGKKLVSPEEAAEIYGCGPSNLRMLAKAGELHRVVESERRVYYYLDEIERLSREKAKTRRKRGGRPRKGTDAA